MMGTLRRKAPLLRRTELQQKGRLEPSRGTEIPANVRAEVHGRDQGCVGPRAGLPGPCDGPLTQDHVRSSGGVGMKSPSEVWNLVDLCAFGHHQWKTEHPMEARPLLLAYLDRVEPRAM